MSKPLKEVEGSAMTDAGEKLEKRLVKMWAALPSKAEHPEVITSVEFTVMCVRAELERAAGIAEQCECGRGGCSCEDHAAAIRKLKE